VQVVARTRAGPMACPSCGVLSARLHSRYRRRLGDAAVGGRRAVIVLSVRRLFCDAAGCDRRTFAEQVEGLTVRYARRTPLLRGMLEQVAVALAGRAGADSLAPSRRRAPRRADDAQLLVSHVVRHQGVHLPGSDHQQVQGAAAPLLVPEGDARRPPAGGGRPATLADALPAGTERDLLRDTATRLAGDLGLSWLLAMLRGDPP
jgi:hypothetical protein